MKWHGSS